MVLFQVCMSALEMSGLIRIRQYPIKAAGALDPQIDVVALTQYRRCGLFRLFLSVAQLRAPE